MYHNRTSPKTTSLSSSHRQSPLVNFCLQPLLSLLHSSTVAADGYAISNLASDDRCCRARGFRVEHFIRPPVHIELHFAHPVSLACIVLQLDLGEGSEARVEVSATSSQPRWTAPLGDDEFRHCGGVAIRSDGASLQFLCNRIFRGLSDRLRQSTMIPGSHLGSPSSLVHSEHGLKSWSGLLRVSALRLSITRLTGVRPVAIRLLEVWACLAPGCSDEQRQTAMAAVASAVQGPSVSVNSHVAVFGSSGELSGRTVPTASNPTATYQCRQPQSLKGSTSTVSHIGPPLLSSGGETVPPRSLGALGSVGRTAEGSQERQRKEEGHGEIEEVRRLFGRQAGRRSQAGPGPTTMKPHGQTLPRGTCESLLVKEAVTSSGLTSFDVQEAHSRDRSSREAVLPPVSHGALGKSPRGELPPPTDVQAPLGFFDELTCEMMQIPMLLPSAHYVDRSTLDRLRHMDLTYGRAPLDPFTGVPFTENSQPQFSPRLKMQIDNFIASHGESPLKSGRGQVLGSASDVVRHLTQCKADRLKRHTNSSSSPPKRFKPTSATGPGKAQGTSQSGSSVSLVSPSAVTTCSTSSSTEMTPLSSPQPAVDQLEPGLNHEDQVAASLDQALMHLFSTH